MRKLVCSKDVINAATCDTGVFVWWFFSEQAVLKLILSKRPPSLCQSLPSDTFDGYWNQSCDFSTPLICGQETEINTAQG